MNSQNKILQGDEFAVVKDCSTIEQDVIEFEIMAGKRLLEFYEMYATSGDERITNKNDYFRSKVAFNFCKGLILQVTSITYNETVTNINHIRFKVISEEEGYRQITLPYDFIEENIKNDSLVAVGRDIQLKEALKTISKSSSPYSNHTSDYYFDVLGLTVHQIRDLINNQSEEVKVEHLKLFFKRSVSSKDARMIKRLNDIKNFPPGWYAVNSEVYNPDMANRKINDFDEFMSKLRFKETQVNVTKIEYQDTVFLLFDDDFDKNVDGIVSDNIFLAESPGRMSMYDFYKIASEELEDGFGGNDEMTYYDVMEGIQRHVKRCHFLKTKEDKEFKSIRISLMP